MPYSRNSLIESARVITAAVDRGELLTLSDVARMTGLSKETINVHRSRGKLPSVVTGIDRYHFAEDVFNTYRDDPNATGAGMAAYRGGTFAAWWKANPRVSRGR